MAQHKRRIKLINAPLQLKLTMIFVGMSALSLLLQFVLFTSKVSGMAAMLPNDGAIVWDEMNGLLIKTLLMSLFAFLPLIFAVGILTTFRIAGPIFRMERFLKEIVRGEDPERCNLRKGDELQDFCRLLNDARDSLVASPVVCGPTDDGDSRQERVA